MSLSALEKAKPILKKLTNASSRKTILSVVLELMGVVFGGRGEKDRRQT
jgi:hypothetical protein